MAAGAALIAAPALADEPTPVAPVEITGALPISSAGTDISAGALGDSDTAGLLTAIPGVDAEGGGGFSSRPVVHGLGDERVNILVDGAPIPLACPNHMNPPLSYTDPHAVVQATVIAGISPVSLGGDSLGGAILIETSEPRFAGSGATLMAGDAGAWYRSNGDGKGGSLSATFASDRLSATYSGEAAQSDDYRGGGADGLVRSTSYETFDQSLALAAKTPAGLFDLKLSAQTAPYEAFPNAFMDMTLNSSWGIDAGWRDDFAWGEMKARAWYRDTLHKMNFLADKGGDANGGMPMRNLTLSSGGLVEADIRLSSNGVLRLGSEVQREQLSDIWAPVMSNMMESPDAFVNMNHGVRTRAGAFAEWENAWTPELSTVLGVRGDLVWMDAGEAHPYAPGLSMADDMAAMAFDMADRGRSDQHFDVSALARYRPGPHAAFELGVSQKTRSPNLYERYAWSQGPNSQMTGWFGDGNGYVGNLDLKPETAQTISGSAEVSGGGAHPWVIKANPYYTRVRDFIDADSMGPIGGMGMGGMGGMGAGDFVLLQFANHRAEIYGADLSGSARLIDSQTFGKVALDASASWVRGTNEDTGVPLYHIMPPKGRVQLTHTLGPWASRLEVVAVDAKTRVDMTRMEPTTPAYTLVNVAGGYAWKNLKLELGVDNLFNKAYAPPLGGVSLGDFAATGMLRSLPGRGRSVNLGLSTRF
jgi:iron complex outermembrane receptor protein